MLLAFHYKYETVSCNMFCANGWKAWYSRCMWVTLHNALKDLRAKPYLRTED